MPYYLLSDLFGLHMLLFICGSKLIPHAEFHKTKNSKLSIHFPSIYSFNSLKKIYPIPFHFHTQRTLTNNFFLSVSSPLLSFSSSPNPHHIRNQKTNPRKTTHYITLHTENEIMQAFIHIPFLPSITNSAI